MIATLFTLLPQPVTLELDVDQIQINIHGLTTSFDRVAWFSIRTVSTTVTAVRFRIPPWVMR